MKRPLMIDPVRLFNAADALLKAIESEFDVNKFVSMAIEEDGDSALDSVDVYTKTELIEAMDLLIRMGYVRSAQKLQ